MAICCFIPLKYIHSIWKAEAVAALKIVCKYEQTVFSSFLKLHFVVYEQHGYNNNKYGWQTEKWDQKIEKNPDLKGIANFSWKKIKCVSWSLKKTHQNHIFL